MWLTRQAQRAPQLRGQRVVGPRRAQREDVVGVGPRLHQHVQRHRRQAPREAAQGAARGLPPTLLLPTLLVQLRPQPAHAPGQHGEQHRAGQAAARAVDQRHGGGTCWEPTCRKETCSAVGRGAALAAAVMAAGEQCRGQPPGQRSHLRRGTLSAVSSREKLRQRGDETAKVAV